MPAAGGGGAVAELLARITAQPAAAPELLAQTAVTEYGPQAQAWAERLRATYPGAPADGLARLAAQRYTRLARSAGAAAVLGGRLGPVAGAGVLGMLQARVVLHIAAAYGVDPTAPERVPELLALASTFRGADQAGPAASDRATVTARAATRAGTDTGRATEPGAAIESAAAADARSATQDRSTLPETGPTAGAWRAAAPLLRSAGTWMMWQAAGRLLPGAGVLLGAHSSADAVRRLAVRAAGYYRTAPRATLNQPGALLRVDPTQPRWP
ncbi:MAG TPA: EcsC family protein [Micromonosporaceae bacterium]|nr:EcsC family protein [Micromonosporaceae bacterium]